MKLRDTASVRSGLVLSRRQARLGEGINYPLLTLRAIRADGYIDTAELDNFHACEVLMPDYVSRCGDIVVRLTAPYTAVLIDQKTEGIVISSNFLIIRADREKILPEYLYWLLNTRKLKMSVYANSTGNMLAAVKPGYFAELTIYPVALAEQKKVAQINLLAQKEVRLLHELAEEKKKYYSAAIDKMQKEVRKHDQSK